MKQFLFIFLIYFGSIFCFRKFAFAQGSFLGGVAGDSLSKISSDSELIKANSKALGLFGVSFGYEFKNSLFVSTSAIYLPRGYRLSSYITISLNETSTEMITMDYSTNYFAQPTKLGYLFGNKIIGFFIVGGKKYLKQGQSKTVGTAACLEAILHRKVFTPTSFIILMFFSAPKTSRE